MICDKITVTKVHGKHEFSKARSFFLYQISHTLLNDRLKRKYEKFLKKFFKKVCRIKKSSIFAPSNFDQRLGFEKMETRSLTWWKNIYENR